ncbi:hypothetical protein KIPB_005654 [Kipferlia bialata]|uniref:Helicase-associated domain-containing protein n=1 Tax=Kipferlia bialata TaxID=797122 RepID=A0A9K3CVR6_9EUKA|nr:hypothetical protein KIPB_005654 [Kipferlia bialata]|eukprot:g5654.t1
MSRRERGRERDGDEWDPESETERESDGEEWDQVEREEEEERESETETSDTSVGIDMVQTEDMPLHSEGDGEGETTFTDQSNHRPASPRMKRSCRSGCEYTRPKRSCTLKTRGERGESIGGKRGGKRERHPLSDVSARVAHRMTRKERGRRESASPVPTPSIIPSDTCPTPFESGPDFYAECVSDSVTEWEGESEESSSETEDEGCGDGMGGERLGREWKGEGSVSRTSLVAIDRESRKEADTDMPEGTIPVGTAQCAANSAPTHQTPQDGIPVTRHNYWMATLWNERFQTLKAFHASHGTWPKVRHGQIGKWMSTQREWRWAGKLGEEKIALLDAINFPWNRQKRNWDGSFQDLSLFLEQHGTWPVAQTSKVLYLWVITQRTLWNRGKLSAAQIEKLRSINFVIDTRESRWRGKVAALQEYWETNKRWPDTQTSLGCFVRTQRDNRQKGVMSQAYIDTLDSMQFPWDPRGQKWEAKVSDFCHYVATHKRLPRSGYDLSECAWCEKQRVDQRSGKLQSVRKAQLDAINFPWERSDRAAGKLCVDTICSRASSRRTPVSLSADVASGDRGMGSGVSAETDSEIHTSASLSAGIRDTSPHPSPAKSTRPETPRVVSVYLTPCDPALSEDLARPVPLHPRKKTAKETAAKEARWTAKLESLSSFITTHQQWPTRGVDSCLYGWVVAQRSSRRKGTLSEDQIERLDSIGIEWNPGKGDFDTSLEALATHIREYGTMPTSAENHTLRNFVQLQRTHRKRGKLSQSRIERLDSIGFVWDASAPGWDACFRDLSDYFSAHGRWPLKGDSRRLGIWMITQRRLRKLGNLSEDRIAMLSSIAFLSLGPHC